MTLPFHRLSPTEIDDATEAVLRDPRRAYDVMRKALVTCSSLLHDVQSTGGLVRDALGNETPSADPTWTDLGVTTLEAQATLEAAGIDYELSTQSLSGTLPGYSDE